MNVLYLGKYKKRFVAITQILSQGKKNKQIIELCFGDIYIAKWCKDNKIEWLGYDINKSFIRFAKLNGFNAYYLDLLEFKDMPRSNSVIMIGSFYHFHRQAEKIIDHIMKFTERLILSEPIKNLSSSKSFVGYLAKRFTNSGRGNETFRYNYETLSNTLRSVAINKYQIKELIKNEREVIFEIKWEQ